MSLSAAIAPFLSSLRRFSRALSGNQESGDAYVVALLEAFIAEPDTLSRDFPPRVALYRSFLKLWGSFALNSDPQVQDDARRVAADRLLTNITPVPRQAFLLVAMEGFSPAEAAQVLDVEQDAVKDLIETAGREMAEEMGADVLIIEDEPLIAMDLGVLVTELGHRVLAVARTQTEALELAEKHRPGLILADIQLADGSSGLTTATKILEKETIPVIFVTSYPERLLTGQRPEPTFVVTKPFQPETIQAIISQALFLAPRSGQKNPNEPVVNAA